MRALWFLTFRLLANSVRRTLRQPVRAVVFILVVGFFVLSFLSNVLSLHESRALTEVNPEPMMPPRYLLLSLMLVHLLMLRYGLAMDSSAIGLFSPADVSFIFPSPMRRLSVFLFLITTRGALSATVTLFFLMVFAGGLGGMDVAVVLAVQREVRLWEMWAYPAMFILAFWTLLLTALVVQLLDERHKGFRGRFHKGLLLVLGGVVALLAWHAYRAYMLGEQVADALLAAVLHDPLVAVPLFPLRALSEAAIAFYQGWTHFVTLGFLFWGGLASLCLFVLWRNETWLYDLGTRVATVTESHRAMRHNPLLHAQAGLLRRHHKQKMGIRWRIFDKWTPQGVWALLWCNAIQLIRVGSYFMVSLIGMLVIIGTMGLISVYRDTVPTSQEWLAVILYLGLPVVIMGWHPWVNNAVKRTDLIKSLPFAGWAVVLIEVTPLHFVLLVFLVVYCGLAALVLHVPVSWLAYHCVVAASAAVPMSLAMVLISLFNPDLTDFTQRFVFTALIFPALIVAALPTVVVILITSLLNLPLWLSAVAVVVANAGVAWVLALVAGERYVQMNPVE